MDCKLEFVLVLVYVFVLIAFVLSTEVFLTWWTYGHSACTRCSYPARSLPGVRILEQSSRSFRSRMEKSSTWRSSARNWGSWAGGTFLRYDNAIVQLKKPYGMIWYGPYLGSVVLWWDLWRRRSRGRSCIFVEKRRNIGETSKQLMCCCAGRHRRWVFWGPVQQIKSFLW